MAAPNDTVVPADAAALAGRLEPLHSQIYFVPEVGEELAPLGITKPRAQYFAQRAAPMGAVGPGVVAATFFNFNPALVARSVPGVWRPRPLPTSSTPACAPPTRHCGGCWASRCPRPR